MIRALTYLKGRVKMKTLIYIGTSELEEHIDWMGARLGNWKIL